MICCSQLVYAGLQVKTHNTEMKVVVIVINEFIYKTLGMNL